METKQPYKFDISSYVVYKNELYKVYSVDWHPVSYTLEKVWPKEKWPTRHVPEKELKQWNGKVN